MEKLATPWISCLVRFLPEGRGLRASARKKGGSQRAVHVDWVVWVSGDQAGPHRKELPEAELRQEHRATQVIAQGLQSGGLPGVGP